MYSADKKHSNSVLHSHCKVCHYHTGYEVGGPKGGVCLIVGGENLGLGLIIQDGFCVGVDDYAREARRCKSHRKS